MELLNCGRNSEAYHRQTLYTYAAEHAHYYWLNDPDMRTKLLDIRSNQESYQGFPETNVFHLDRPLAQQLIEVRYCMDLKPVCARHTIQWRDHHITLSGRFDGLENGRKGGMVWVHIPYSKEKHGLIASLGWSEFLDRPTRLYLEHLMLISESRECMVTMSDGTFANTITHEYETVTSERFNLLDCYATFEADLKALQSIKYGGRDA